MRIVRTARAKINLALHVVGQRADGYHLLDTLVTFAPFGDEIAAEADDRLSLEVHGPFGETLKADPDGNLVLRAASLLADEAMRRGAGPVGARIRLDKHLPIASGVGGGSADAAATLLALNDLWNLDIAQSRLAEIGLMLGADVPMCLAGVPARVTGIGEHVAPGPGMPEHGLVLVNPRVPIATPAVFRSLKKRDHAPMPDLPDAWDDVDHLVDWLKTTRNDLQPPAETIAPAVGEVMAVMTALPGCRLARMSGSGATCFGIFDDRAAAIEAQTTLRRERANWWIE
jgi:4-diphosphocytidyl-2-C-methyl-D-erythritol kinase